MEDKESEIVAGVIDRWMGANGCLIRLYAFLGFIPHVQISWLFYRYCDNGTEFKGALQNLIDIKHMPIIRGRSYYP
jgi:hypothetical protein